MKLILVLVGAVLTITGACLGFAAQDDVDAKPAAKPAANAADQESTRQTEKNDASKNDAETKKDADPAEGAAEREKSAIEDAAASSVPAKYADDEKAIREIHEKLIAAYCADDAKGVAALFAEEGEYVNAAGELFQGRDDIQTTLEAFMAEHSGCKLEGEISEIRFLGPSVAVVDGLTTVTHAEHSGTTRCKFHAVYSKNDGTWQIASVRDQEAKQLTSHEDHLAQLDFLNGEWIDEDEDSVVSFQCRPVDNGKFLIREFTLSIGGRELMSGSQRIGWDPLNGRIRTWIFDSEGGFAEGTWQQRGDDHWTVPMVGVTAEGQIATGTSVYRIINSHRMTWQSVDYEVNGNPVADSPVFTLTRRSPSPGTDVEDSKISLKP